jgi:hypothetical protein
LGTEEAAAGATLLLRLAGDSCQRADLNRPMPGVRYVDVGRHARCGAGAPGEDVGYFLARALPPRTGGDTDDMAAALRAEYLRAFDAARFGTAAAALPYDLNRLEADCTLGQALAAQERVGA